MGVFLVNGGMLTTVQDSGRYGFQKYGVGAAGAMDQRSMRIANILVGNTLNEAVLEVTLVGPVIRFTSGNFFAATGGDLGALLNGRTIQPYSAVRAEEGDVLSFKGRRSGCRAYIAFAGGLDIPCVLGSKATYLRSHFGGFEGRALRSGDKIAFKAPPDTLPNMLYRTAEPEIFREKEILICVVLEPQDSAFTKHGLNTFLPKRIRSPTKLIDRECALTVLL